MKETFYLKHDYNSRNDERVLKLRSNLGIEGYGIFWMILEKLAESSEGRLKLEDIDSIAFELHSDSKRTTDVVQGYNLFQTDNVYFWSNRLMSDLEERNEKSKKAILANKIRWDKERKKLQTDSKRTPFGIQGEERRGKEKRESNTMSKEDFEKFWDVYPLRKDKRKAEEKFMRLPKNLLPTILEAIEAQKKEKVALKERKEFCPEWKHPTTWINGECWTDEATEPSPLKSEDPPDYDLSKIVL